MAKICPKCRQRAVPPAGPKDAAILILAEYPGETELDYGMPLVGPTGKVLREELSRVGIDMRQCRLGNIWIHPPNDNEECYNLSMSIVMREVSNRKGILLLGSDPAKEFVGKPVMDICGLRVEDDCTLLKAEVIVCSPNPAIVFKPGGSVGEVRFAIEQFAKAMDKYI